MSKVDTLVAMGAPMNPRRIGSGPQTAIKRQGNCETLCGAHTKEVV